MAICSKMYLIGNYLKLAYNIQNLELTNNIFFQTLILTV